MSLLAPSLYDLACAFGMGCLVMSGMINPRMLLSVSGACILYCAAAAFHTGNHKSTLLAICGTVLTIAVALVASLLPVWPRRSQSLGYVDSTAESQK